MSSGRNWGTAATSVNTFKPRKEKTKQNKNVWIEETADSLTSFKLALGLHLGGAPDLALELKGSSTPQSGGEDAPG